MDRAGPFLHYAIVGCILLLLAVGLWGHWSKPRCWEMLGWCVGGVVALMVILLSIAGWESATHERKQREMMERFRRR